VCTAHDNTPDADRSDIDCDQGRALGCQVFCCRLLVRLEPDERPPAENGLAQKGYMDKDPDGYCIHFDRERGLCRIWEQRPRICRSYSCNTDPLLQVALRYPFRNLADLLRASARALIPRGTEKTIPYLDPETGNGRDRKD
jgi:hypothetical protein